MSLPPTFRVTVLAVLSAFSNVPETLFAAAGLVEVFATGEAAGEAAGAGVEAVVVVEVEPVVPVDVVSAASAAPAKASVSAAARVAIIFMWRVSLGFVSAKRPPATSATGRPRNPPRGRGRSRLPQNGLRAPRKSRAEPEPGRVPHLG